MIGASGYNNRQIFLKRHLTAYLYVLISQYTKYLFISMLLLLLPVKISKYHRIHWEDIKCCTHLK